MKEEIQKIAESIESLVKGCGQSKQAVNTEGLPFVIVRGENSGAMAGYLKKRESREVTLINVRRLWYWDGAASLSQLAQDGVSKPENCKFPKEVSEILILDAIEILSVSEKAKKSIDEVKVWQA